MKFKGTVSIISCEPPCKDGSVQYPTLALKALSDQVCIKYIPMFFILKTDFLYRGLTTSPFILQEKLLNRENDNKI